MNPFTYKGYGRIYVLNQGDIYKVENIIKETDEFEWDYYPTGLVAILDSYPNLIYVGEFELNFDLEEECKKHNIPIFIFSSGIEDCVLPYQSINKEEIKTLMLAKINKNNDSSANSTDSNIFKIAEFTKFISFTLSPEQLLEIRKALNLHHLGDVDANYLNPDTLQYVAKHPDKETSEYRNACWKIQSTFNAEINVYFYSDGSFKIANHF